MTEARYLSPPEWDEEANRMAIIYDEETKRLRQIKEQLCTLEEAFENADALDRLVRAGIDALLDRQRGFVIELEKRIEIYGEYLKLFGCGNKHCMEWGGNL